MSKLRGRVLAAFVLTGLVVLLGDARGAASGPLETRLGFSICPNITTTTYPQTPLQTVPGCGPAVMSPNNINIPPNGNTCEAPTGNRDLGAFLTTQRTPLERRSRPGSRAVAPRTLRCAVAEPMGWLST